MVVKHIKIILVCQEFYREFSYPHDTIIGVKGDFLMNLHKIAKVTRLNKLTKGRMLLIAAAVSWSAMNCSVGTCTAAEAASLMALSGGAITATEIGRAHV